MATVDVDLEVVLLRVEDGQVRRGLVDADAQGFAVVVAVLVLDEDRGTPPAWPRASAIRRFEGALTILTLLLLEAAAKMLPVVAAFQACLPQA